MVTLERLRTALHELLPETSVWVYGSLLVPGKFSEDSDVDVALECDPADVSLYVLQSLLSGRVGCEVDICVLDESRLKTKIQQTGQRWIG